MAFATYSKSEDNKLDFRPADLVMDLKRLGTLYPYPLSFMRSLVRRMMGEQWCIDRTSFNLDADGFGDAIYEIHTRENIYSFVIFANFIEPEVRSDRVIAEQWDMTVTLCEGKVDADRLEYFRQNVPLQEKGRLDASCLVLSRANKSARNFEYVIDRLSSGQQPDLAVMAKVGYLYRTTAVYGSGKFGMADWQKVKSRYPEFARPFSAEMFSCYMIRHFSLEQADFIARQSAPKTAVGMEDKIKRYVGIGNATGLGMAPYLINHPLLINGWIEARETALARMLAQGEFNASALDRFFELAARACQHLQEISTDNLDQNAINHTAKTELSQFIDGVQVARGQLKSWAEIMQTASQDVGMETQELIVSLLIEVHPELSYDLEDSFVIDDEFILAPEMPLEELKALIEEKYDWALGIDFNDKNEQGSFWYRSEEKMEPRLGSRYEDPGADQKMVVDVCRPVQRCYRDLCTVLESGHISSVAALALSHPQHRAIMRRIQTMGRTRYGDIRANLLAKDVLPIHLLRCKLSFFGVGKFDPRSRLWVRNTMFQGAPLQSDIGKSFVDDWCFPVMPQ